MTRFWRVKIAANRERDRRNFAALRRRRWLVVRVWHHQVKRSLDAVVEHVEELLGRGKRAG
jgi:G:T-mismatch repair DNA endonuclease (very short patch repair protein)